MAWSVNLAVSFPIFWFSIPCKDELSLLIDIQLKQQVFPTFSISIQKGKFWWVDGDPSQGSMQKGSDFPLSIGRWSSKKPLLGAANYAFFNKFNSHWGIPFISLVAQKRPVLFSPGSLWQLQVEPSPPEEQHQLTYLWGKCQPSHPSSSPRSSRASNFPPFSFCFSKQRGLAPLKQMDMDGFGELFSWTKWSQPDFCGCTLSQNHENPEFRGFLFQNKIK